MWYIINWSKLRVLTSLTTHSLHLPLTTLTTLNTLTTHYTHYTHHSLHPPLTTLTTHYTHHSLHSPLTTLTTPTTFLPVLFLLQVQEVDECPVMSAQRSVPWCLPRGVSCDVCTEECPVMCAQRSVLWCLPRGVSCDVSNLSLAIPQQFHSWARHIRGGGTNEKEGEGQGGRERKGQQI